MIDESFINRKISLIQRDIDRLKQFQGETFDDIAKDWKKYSIIKNLLMEIIGRAIDINQHIILELSEPKNGPPLDYTETFLKLIDLDVLPKKFGENIARSAGFRNAVVHGYDDLDETIVYKSIDEAVDQYSQYCEYILNLAKE